MAMLDDVKILLGDRATLYSDTLIGLEISHAQAEIEGYCNRSFTTPSADITAVIEKIAVIKLNRMNTEGVSNQSAGGVSETYIDGYPADILAVLNRYRKFKVM